MKMLKSELLSGEESGLNEQKYKEESL